jgi:hypothetical protein
LIFICLKKELGGLLIKNGKKDCRSKTPEYSIKNDNEVRERIKQKRYNYRLKSRKGD